MINLIKEAISYRLYEQAPHHRTIKVWDEDTKTNHYYYLKFPYSQYVLRETGYNSKTFCVFFSLEPFPSRSIELPEILMTNCLGSDWDTSRHSDRENIAQFINSSFVIASNYDYRDIEKYQNNDWQYAEPYELSDNVSEYLEACHNMYIRNTADLQFKYKHA